MTSPPSLLFPRLNSPGFLRLSSQQVCSSPLIIFTVLARLAPGSLYLSCTGKLRTGHSTPALQRGSITTLGLLARVFLTQPRILLAFFAPRVQCWLSASHLSRPHGPLHCRAVFQPVYPRMCQRLLLLRCRTWHFPLLITARFTSLLRFT